MKLLLGLHRDDQGNVTPAYKVLAEIDLDPTEAIEINRALVKTALRVHAINGKKS